jgi:uncharacterized protein YcbK (DUF882 family)
MTLRRIALFAFLLGLMGAVAAPEVAEAGKRSKKTKVCKKVGKGKKAKKKCSYVAEFSGHGVKKDELRTEPLERPSGNLWVVSRNVQLEAKVNIYAADGSYDEAVLAELDEVFRCKRSNETRAMDPRLYEQLSRISDQFGGAQVEIVSGFRFTERNSSRHHHASAMDIRIKGVGIRELYEYAQTLDMGGMGIGIYPNSEFVHVDFRAPGEPSYRWTDRSYPDGGKPSKKSKKSKKSKARTTKAKRPTS